MLPQMHLWYPAGGGIFQQDNAPCHKSASVTAMLQNEGVHVLHWPPYSPDISPIENLWAIVKAKVHTYAFASKDELVAQVLHIWHNDEHVRDACIKLIDGMPRRIQACIAAKGGVMKY
jgi:transposase